MRRILLMAVGFGVIAAAPAMAQTSAAPPGVAEINAESFTVRSVGDLATLCRTPQTHPAYAEAIGFCYGYGRGALDYHRASTSAAARPLFCVPSSAAPDPGETVRRFVAWSDANPARRSERAVDGMFRFLAETFPCPQPTTRR